MINNKVKVLHVANWYPNPWDDVEGIFVKQQLELFGEITDTHVLNVQVRPGPALFKYVHTVLGERVEGYYIVTRLRGGRAIELFTTLLLLFALMRHRVNRFQVLHIHIAYPLLSLFHFWKWLIKPRVLISEHWSAYHFHFWLPAQSTGLRRIRRIFHHQVPVIGVSRALTADIQQFSQRDDFATAVLPNVLDTGVFHYREQIEADSCIRLFAVNVWRDIKNPFPLLEALATLQAEGVGITLRIGGFGPIEPQMQDFARANNLRNVAFLGKLNKADIAKELASCDAYVFTSLYETFSVACAQALCCGCPLIGPALPAVLEYTDASSHVIVSTHTAEAWREALRKFEVDRSQFDRKAIAARAALRFSPDSLLHDYEALLVKFGIAGLSNA